MTARDPWAEALARLDADPTADLFPRPPEPEPSRRPLPTPPRDPRTGRILSH